MVWVRGILRVLRVGVVATLIGPFINALPSYAGGQEALYVSRGALDCFVRANPRQKVIAQNLYYIDLRGCPPGKIVIAPPRFGSLPRFRRPEPPAAIFGETREKTSAGAPIDSVLVVTGTELSCLQDQRSLAKVREIADDQRYLLRLDRCA